MKKRILILIVLIALVALAAVTILARSGRSKKSEADVPTSGNIEAIQIGLSFRVPGRVVSRPVDEGMRVHVGQVIAELDKSTFQHEVDVRAAALALAQSQLAELEHGSRPEEIKSARAAVVAAEAEEARWAEEQKREANLYKDGVLPQNQFEATDTAYRSARERANQAKEALRLLEIGPRSEKIDQARAAVAQAQAALSSARTQLSFTTLTSPVAGVVSEKKVEAGEQVNAGTVVVTVTNLQNVWLRSFIDETDLGRIQQGQKVRVTTDSYPGKVYQGVISYISPDAEFTPRTVQTTKERVKLVYRIKIDIDNPNFELKPGMPADGDINLARP